MKKVLLLTLLFALFTTVGFSQADKFWSGNNERPGNIIKDKAVARQSFPTVFKLFNLNVDAFRQELFTVAGNQASRHSTVISLPNAEGHMEQFEIFEASNFEPALQAQFPQIRAFSGKGITDIYATLKLSISPQGIQTMVFRTDKENEFIEPYSQNHIVYAVFRSQRKPGQLPWTCATQDQEIASGISSKIEGSNFTASSTGELKTMRLAQSCNAEYSNYFGATSAAQVGLALAAFNATLTRCNGVYEKDLALHLNLIANTSAVIYYNPSTDPYTSMGSWNSQLQSTLTSVIGEANYDIGHMFGASGGGGNAGCIGCVCSNGSKGSGITSPADGIPQGDNFDIDYVVHEVGHQLGANHTFSHSLEGSGVNKEVGSGITIMGYAGITPYDVAPHSIDIFHQASIAQIQANLATKTCPVTTIITANNATPVIAAVSNYTIPKSTPFALTGSATDANAGDVLTYCWEQNNNATTSGANSVASPTKATGPNWLSFNPTTSPTRYCPRLSTILAGGLTTGPLAGGDAGANIEALSSVARTLNFRLTVRDNAPYSSSAPIKVGQTAFTDMVVTVNAVAGPFAVSIPNTAVSWAGNSSQTITWSVASTTLAPVSCANVKISLSTDGGQTFPTVLSASTVNDGTEVLTIPNTPTTTARIKVEAVGNIFFDISNTNFTISAAAGLTTITTSAIAPTTYCAGAAVSVPYTTNAAANAGNVFTAQLSNASGSFASPVAIGTLSSTAAGTISATIPAGTAAGTGYRIRVVSSAPVVTGTDNGSNITVNTAPAASTITAGGPTTFCSGNTVILSGNNAGGTWSTGSSATTLTVTASGDYFVTNTNSCASVQSNHITVTVNPLPTATITPAGPTTFCQGGSVVLNANTGTGLTYQWRMNGVTIGGATSATFTATVGGSYTVVVANSNGCLATSSAVTVTVTASATASVSIGANPAGAICAGTSVTFTATPTNGGTPPSYNWKVNGVSVSGGQQVGLNVITISSLVNGDAVTCDMAVNPNAGSCVTPAVATSNTITMVVNPVPVATITPAGSTTFCQGSSVLLNANTAAGFTYQWRVGGSNIVGATASSLTVTSAGSYAVIITNSSSCKDTSSAITITVNPLPTVSFSGLAASYTVNAANATLTGSPAGGTFSGPGISGNVFSPSTAGVGGPYTIAYTYTNGNGCTNSASQQTTVTAACTVPNKPGTITTVGGTAKVCPGDVKTYTIVAVSGATSYTWTAPPGGVVTSGQGTTSATVTYNAGFTVGDSLRVTANNSCGSSIPRALKINRNAAPGTPSAITGSVYGVCNSNAVPYSVTVVSGNTYTWSWNVGDATIASGQGTNSTTTNFASTFVTGKLSVTASNACGTSAARTLTVYARPAVPVVTGATSVCSGQFGVPYSITAVPGASSYIWYAPSGSHISDGTTTSPSSSLGTTATNVTVNFGTTAGQVRAKGVNACAAGSVGSLTVSFTCRENAPAHSNGNIVGAPANVQLYPNPSNGTFRIILANVHKISTAKIEIMNEFGQVLYQSNENCNNGIIDMNLDDKLANGMYMVSCTVNGVKTVKKLMISK